MGRQAVFVVTVENLNKCPFLFYPVGFFRGRLRFCPDLIPQTNDVHIVFILVIKCAVKERVKEVFSPVKFDGVRGVVIGLSLVVPMTEQGNTTRSDLFGRAEHVWAFNRLD